MDKMIKLCAPILLTIFLFGCMPVRNTYKSCFDDCVVLENEDGFKYIKTEIDGKPFIAFQDGNGGWIVTQISE